MKKKNAEKYRFIGLLRIRNEALILHDTLDHLAQFVDGIVVFDDASTDRSAMIARSHQKVVEVIQNKKWWKDRLREETRQRQILLEAGQKYNPEWFFNVDADERFEGEIRKFLLSPKSRKVVGIRVRLLDAYLTEDNHRAYKQGKLFGFRKYFGPEMREILMIFRHQPEVIFKGLDAREPYIKGKIITKFWCQHYGKSLSCKHWEKTCDYYAEHFPKYAKKWKARQGKAIHALSDFSRPLYSWEEVKRNTVSIHKYQGSNLNVIARGIRKISKRLQSFLISLR